MASIGATVDNLYAVCQTLYASTLDSQGNPALVSVADPGQYQPGIIIAVATEIRMPIYRPTAGTGRSREQRAEIDVLMSVYVPGGPEAQLTAIDKALALQAQLETYFRTSPNETLSGACREAFVTNGDLVPYIGYQPARGNGDPIPIGRVAANTVTVTAFIRY